MSVADMLSKLEGLIDQIAYLESTMNTLKDEVLPAETKIKLIEIEEEFGEKISALKEQAEQLKKEIREEALRTGEGAKGNIYQVIVAERENWDREALNQIAQQLPVILEARSADRYVQIREKR